MSGHTLDVLVICEINVDIIVRTTEEALAFGAERLSDGIMLAAGSSGVLTATGLRALNKHVGLCGLVGADLFGRYMLDHLDRLGIDRGGVVVDPHARTGASAIISTPRDRAILTSPGAMSQFRAEMIVDSQLKRARHLHISSYFLQAALQAGLPDLLKKARTAGLTISADTGHDPAERWEIGDLWHYLDILLPNETEAHALAGTRDTHQALEYLASRVPTVVIKMGGSGAIAAHRGNQIHVPGFPVTVLDTTGAGDAFDAGFLASWLENEPLYQCVRRGNACGALTAAHMGGAGGFTAEDIAQLLEER